MKGFATGLLLFAASTAFAQAPDPRDSVILESKFLMPGADAGSSSDTSAYLYVRVWITNKDTLANFTLPVEIRSISNGGFAVLGYPRNFNGTVSRWTSTLGNNLTFSSFANSASPDSALWAGFWDPNDTTTAEPPNATRKVFWELKFDTAKTLSNPGEVQIDSAVVFDNRVGFVDISGSSIRINFLKSMLTISFEGCQVINCGAAGGNVLYGRNYSFHFNSSLNPVRWSIRVGPGTIDSLTGIYSFSGRCQPGAIPVTVRSTASDGSDYGCDCQFTINVIDNAPSCSPAQETVTVSHEQMANNQVNASDPDAGDSLLFSKLSGPGAVNASGAWSYPTGCSDVGTSPQTVRVKTADAFGSCNPGPLADTCEFQLVVTNAAPGITNCPEDVLPIDTGQTFSLQLSASDADPADAGSLLFFLVSAPAGFSVSSSGFVQWTPTGTQWGLKSATVQVRDMCGASTNCQINFAVSLQKGDLNADGQLTPADLVHIFHCIYLATPPPAGRSACDLNCSGGATPADAILLLNTVYLGAAFPC